MYNKNTVYVIGHGKTSSDNAITEKFKLFFMQRIDIYISLCQTLIIYEGC